MDARGAGNEGFDHITVVVTDLSEAKSFFGALGFEERTSVAVSGEEMSRYMGIDQWEADHVTLALEGGVIHQEVQLLYFHRPQVIVDSTAGSLDRTGFNHVCFRVRDLDEALGRLARHGFTPRNEIMEFHDRRLVFLDGPGIVVELAQWVTAPGEASGLVKAVPG
jgi:catechol 2,3-dioxygenase-like lactoylglutathione lyase family enzyme